VDAGWHAQRLRDRCGGPNAPRPSKTHGLPHRGKPGAHPTTRRKRAPGSQARATPGPSWCHRCQDRRTFPVTDPIASSNAIRGNRMPPALPTLLVKLPPSSRPSYLRSNASCPGTGIGSTGPPQEAPAGCWRATGPFPGTRTRTRRRQDSSPSVRRRTPNGLRRLS
jgi:hypothetical protein